jgi:hypothetical protein
MSEVSRSGAARWIGLALGWTVIGYGVAGALGDADKTMPSHLAVWVIGAGAVHDLAVAPLLVLVGWLVARLVPGAVRRPVTAGLVLSAVVLLVGVIPLRGYGDRANATLHPIDYGTAIGAVLTMIWLAVAASCVLVVRRQRAGA